VVCLLNTQSRNGKDPLHSQSFDEFVPLAHTRVSIIVCVDKTIQHLPQCTRKKRTEAPTLVAWALSLLPCFEFLWAVRIWIMLVSDVVKEMYLIGARKKGCGNAMNRRVAPSLRIKKMSGRIGQGIWFSLWDAPRSRILQLHRGIQKILYRFFLARSPCLQSRSCSRLIQAESRISNDDQETKQTLTMT